MQREEHRTRDVHRRLAYLVLLLVMAVGCSTPTDGSTPPEATVDQGVPADFGGDACGPTTEGCGDVGEPTARCDDGDLNGDESDVDCGGGCTPCEVGETCTADTDCALELCRDNLCAAVVCGDGVVDAPEECDDGNTVDGDGCNGQCAAEGCGNGIVEAGEGDCDCPEGFRNTDGDPETGCECEVLSDTDATCNGLDEDCDGAVDEDFRDDRPLFSECLSVDPPCGPAGERERVEQLCVDGEFDESRTEEDCPAMTDGVIVDEGDWGECQPGPDGCSLLGSQTRTVSTCRAGAEEETQSTQECQLPAFPNCGEPISQGWTQYHTQVESCFPNYNGPPVARFEVGEAMFPECDDRVRGQVWCASRSDGSPSRCLVCEDNLFICR